MTLNGASMRRGVAICTALRGFPKATSAIGTPSVRSTQHPISELTRDLEQPCQIRDAASARFTPSRPTIINGCKPSTVGNSPSMG